MRRFVIAAALATLASHAGAAGSAMVAGAYENTLMIGYDPTSGLVTGYFDMAQPGPPAVTCAFALKGKLAGRAAAVDTAYPGLAGDLIKGTLAAQTGGKVRVALATDHGGCANVWSFADTSNPADFTLDEAYPWTQVRVAKNAKTYFYPAPAAAARGRAYVVEGDGLGVRRVQGDWLQVDYTGGAHVVSGWAKAEDLYPSP